MNIKFDLEKVVYIINNYLTNYLKAISKFINRELVNAVDDNYTRATTLEQ